MKGLFAEFGNTGFTCFVLGIVLRVPGNNLDILN